MIRASKPRAISAKARYASLFAGFSARDIIRDLRNPATRAAAEQAARSLALLEGDSCFVAGTPLLTPDGSKPIDQIRTGDRVLARSQYDVHGRVEGKTVECVFVRKALIFGLRVAGREIRTTGGHPFYLEDRGWVCAKELKPGDRLASHDGQWVTVEAVSDLKEVATVYNLRVCDYHTYFVGSREWGFSVWAHNANYAVVQEGPNVFRLYQIEANGTRTAVRDLAGEVRTFANAEEAFTAVRTGPAATVTSGTRANLPGYGWTQDARWRRWTSALETETGVPVHIPGTRENATRVGEALIQDAFPGYRNIAYEGQLSQAPNLRGTYQLHAPHGAGNPHDYWHWQIWKEDGTIVRIRLGD